MLNAFQVRESINANSPSIAPPECDAVAYVKRFPEGARCKIKSFAPVAWTPFENVKLLTS
jgi:hypothetical protein